MASSAAQIVTEQRSFAEMAAKLEQSVPDAWIDAKVPTGTRHVASRGRSLVLPAARC
jgi:hypothetical protein